MFGSKPPWGWLYPYQDNLPTHALRERSLTVGVDKSDTVVVAQDHFGGKLSVEQFASLVLDPHLFKVKRKDDEVVLKSTSKCDIFINGTKVTSQKEKYVLQHNDFLAIIKPEARAFVYLASEAVEKADFPKEIKDKYVPSKKIGKGGFGVVTLMFHKKTGRKYAVKKILKTKQQKYAETEKKILTTVSHPHVIYMEEVFDTPESLYIVLEYMEGGDLSDRISRSFRLIEHVAKFVFYQIALAVNYLHDLNIAHRDLKPENILLSSDDTFTLVKIADFGVSKAEWNTKLRTSLGTPSYEAPEVIRAADTGKAYTNKVDVWSLGVILFYCLSGKLPFESWDEILSGKYQFSSQTLAKISKISEDLVRKMLIVDPARRLDMKQILGHQWLQDNMVRRKVESLSQGSKPRGEPMIPSVPKKEVVHQHHLPLPKPMPVASPNQVPASAQVLSARQVGKNAIHPIPARVVDKPQPAHVEKNLASGGGNKPSEKKFFNERRPGQPRGVLRFLPEVAVDRGGAEARPPESLEAYRRIDNRRTQPFPGTVKKKLHMFEMKKS